MNSKQREALEKCVRRLDAITPYLPLEFRKYVFADIQEAKSALAEPLKNCEVGIVEEQTERFRKFCFAHMKKGGGDFSCHKNCPAKNYIGGWGIPYCQLKWAQMPYESEVKNG